MTVLLFLLACGGTNPEVFATCEVDLELTSTSGAVGDEIQAVGGPFTEPYDTTVLVGGVRAEVVDIDEDGTDELPEACSLCDSCRADPDLACASCGRCIPCEAVCDECTETVTFIVPATATGATQVTVTNGHGISDPQRFVVIGSGTGTTADTAADTGADTSDTADSDVSGDTADSDTGASASGSTADTGS